MSDQAKFPPGKFSSNPPPPVAGGKPSSPPLPGLGAKLGAPLPSFGRPGGAPLPSFGKPGSAPLPGLGAPPAAGLPGLGRSPGGGAAAVPPFMQQPQAPVKPPKDLTRDPFAVPISRPSYRPSYGPGGLIGETAEGFVVTAAGEVVKVHDVEAAKKKKQQIIVILGATLLMLLVGFVFGQLNRGKGEINVAIRDGLILQYELKKATQLFDEADPVLKAAASNAAALDTKHLDFIQKKMRASPLKLPMLVERNYKSFDPTVVQGLADYFAKWVKLAELAETHRRKTGNDQPMLAAEKQATDTYGAVFLRDAAKESLFSANVVVMSAPGEGGKVSVQTELGSPSEELELLTIKDDKADELSKNPESYVVAFDEQTKKAFLENASARHLDEYNERLREIGDLMKQMREIQAGLTSKIDKIASQSPSFFGSPNPKDSLQQYILGEQQAAAENAS